MKHGDGGRPGEWRGMAWKKNKTRRRYDVEGEKYENEGRERVSERLPRQKKDLRYVRGRRKTI